jgi:transcriptional regulator with XRE-family HTH domain
MSINNRINQVRLALELTQSKFAERIAVSSSYLAGMERSDKKVNDRVIRLISMEFGISEHWIRTGIGEMYSETENINIAKIVSLYKSLTPKYQECALSQMNALADLQNIDKQ